MGEIEEACPDIEITIMIRSKGKVMNSLEVSINKSRFVKELKQSLAQLPEVDIHPSSMRILVGDLEMDDDLQICMYDVETDDKLIVDHMTGTTTTMTNTNMATTTQMAAVDNVV